METENYGAIVSIISFLCFIFVLIGLIITVFGLVKGPTQAIIGGITLCITGVLFRSIARIIELLTDIRNNLKQ